MTTQEIPGHEGRYSVDSDGRVWSHLRGIYLAQSTNRCGYPCVYLWLESGKKQTACVHQLMAMAFLGWRRRCGTEIDHINRDKMDNRLANLRLATRSQNMANRGHRKDNTSGHRGVWWNKKCGKWQAAVALNRKKFHLGLYENLTEASEAYDKAAVRLFGDFVVTNGSRTRNNS